MVALQHPERNDPSEICTDMNAKEGALRGRASVAPTGLFLWICMDCEE